MTENLITVSGLLQRLSTNFALKVAEFEFNTAGVDANDVSNKTIAAHPTRTILPAHALVVGGFVDVNTLFNSAASTATIALSVEGANDIITAAAVSGAPWSTIGIKAIIPKANTPESTSIKTTVARAITATVAVQVLTVGKLHGYLYYIVGVASA